jgi:prephenate dehydrogenase
MPARLKIGVIGLGRMGHLYAQTLVTSVPGVQLYAVADSDEHLRTTAMSEFHMHLLMLMN